MYLCPVNYIFLECSGIFLTHDSLPLGDPSGDLAALDKKIESLMGRAAGGELQCLVCGKLGSVRQNMRNHIETHVGEVVSCEMCGKQFKTRNSLNVHRSTKHKPIGQQQGNNQQYGFTQ